MPPPLIKHPTNPADTVKRANREWGLRCPAALITLVLFGSIWYLRIMFGTLNPSEEAQLRQTIEMFEVITQSQPQDSQSLEILKEAYLKLSLEPEVISTSKRIAQAYVQLGQLSSAILEYETILQRHPDDRDAMEAMAQIETKANNLTKLPPMELDPAPPSETRPSRPNPKKPKPSPSSTWTTAARRCSRFSSKPN